MRNFILIAFLLSSAMSFAQIPYISVDGSNFKRSDNALAKEGAIIALEIRPNESNWTWTGPNGFSADGAGVYILDFSLEKSGEYVATREVYGEVQTLRFNITLLKPEYAQFENDVKVCGSQIVELTAEAGTSYKWNTGEITQSIFVSSESDAFYSVTVTSPLGYVGIGQVAVIDVENQDIIEYIKTPCSTLSTVYGPTGYSNYSWSTGSTANQEEFDFADGEMLTLEATTATGCEARYYYLMDINSNPTDITFETSVVDPQSCDQLGTVSISVDGYKESDFPMSLNFYQNGFLTQESIINSDQEMVQLTAGTYEVKLVSSYGCFFEGSDVNISHHHGLHHHGVSEALYCAGDLVSIEPPFGYDEYLWSDGSIQPSKFFTATETVNYTLDMVTNGNCIDRIVYVIDVDEELNLGYEVFNATYSEDGFIRIYNTSETNEWYSVYINSQHGDNIFLGESTEEEIFIPLPVGQYSNLRVENFRGCSTTLGDVNIEQETSYSEVIMPDIEACEGEKVYLDAPTGYASYSWFDGITASTYLINANSLTQVYVDATDNLGNLTRYFYTVIPIDNPSANFSTDPSTDTQNGKVNISLTNGVSAMYPLEVSIKNSNGSVLNLGSMSSSNASFQLAAGTYTELKIVSAQGCETALGDLVISTVVLEHEDVTFPDIILCTGEEVLLAGPSGYRYYTWSDGKVSSIRTVSPQADITYVVTGRDLLGNTKTYTYNIIVYPSVRARLTINLRQGFNLGSIRIDLTTYSNAMFPIEVKVNDFTGEQIDLGTISAQSTTFDLSDGPYNDLILITSDGCVKNLGSFNMYETASQNIAKSIQVSGKVWLDEAIKVGILEPSEDGLAGITVRAIDLEGEVKGESVTDAAGEYTLKLHEDTYYLEFDADGGLSETVPHMGSFEDIDSDIDGSNGPGTTEFFILEDSAVSYNLNGGYVLGVLPIEWRSVSVSQQERSNLVEWEVDMEYNVSHYEIEKSIGSIEDFSLIGSVEFHGERKVKKNYQFSDDFLASGTSYYRIKQVDLDGAYNYSKVVSVERKAQKTVNNEIDIYPNPASDRVMVDMVSCCSGQTLQVSLYDNLGRLVKNIDLGGIELFEGENQFSIELKDLQSGTYNAFFILPEMTVIKKIIVEK